jgi:hypothetical protein
LISNDTLESPTDTYSIELWAKPAYFHHATLFSLLQWEPPQTPIGTHRMVLELCGPVSWFTSPYRTTDQYPGRIRFVHETRTSFDVDCYSSKPYAVRQWQHLAAVKSASEMRLYVNGQLADSKEAGGVLSRGAHILMGQLLPGGSEADAEVTPRLFSGELDEVALYDRALNEKEIQEHFGLGRPTREQIDDNALRRLQ